MTLKDHQVIAGTDGITVVISSYGASESITLTEEEFEQIAVTFATAMEPIYAARAKAKREAESAKTTAALEAGQKVTDIAGHKVRLQYRVTVPFEDEPPIVEDVVNAAWLEGFSRSDAPFVVERDPWGAPVRPFVIRGKVYDTNFSGIPLRREVYGPSGGVTRFSTAEAAFKRAIQYNLHKVEETTA